MSHLPGDENPDNAALTREVARLSAELERATGLLTRERAMFQSELERGAQELARRDEVVERLRVRREKLIRERDRARRKVRMYEGSRVVRLAARLVNRVRRLRGLA